MKDQTFIGIDNGVTGSIGVLYPNGTSAFIQTPVFKTPSYTKKVQYIHRIDWANLVENMPKGDGVIALIERPMVNPRAFTATISALRALEATVIALEIMGIKYSYIDSKTWQQEFISSACIGHKEMKEASMQIGCQLFPCHLVAITKHSDADGLLIAEYLRRQHNNEL